MASCSLSFVGISNWTLDASKMNRAIHLSVQEPDLEDLILTANTIANDIYEEIEFSEHCQSEKERTDSDEEELLDKSAAEMDQDYMDQIKGANALLEKKKRERKFKVLALAIFASRKLKVMKEEKKIARIKEFNQTLLSVDEYLEKLLDEFMVKPKNAISQYKTRIDLTLSNNVEKLEEFMKNITDTLIIKTTKVKFGRTISTFFKRYIFDMDLVQPSFFSLFEKKRIVYVKGGELDHEQKMFVLIMKIVVGILIYVVLYKETENTNPVIAYNFKVFEDKYNNVEECVINQDYYCLEENIDIDSFIKYYIIHCIN